MEVFQGVEFVRLRSLVHRKYIHADADGSSVRLDARGNGQTAIWAVEWHNSAGDGEGPDSPYILLRGAYGRYLGAPESLCCRVDAAQLDFDAPETRAIMWRAVGKDGDAVLLHDPWGRYLHGSSRRLSCIRGRYVCTSDRLWIAEGVVRDTEKQLRRNDDALDVSGKSKREIRWVLADNAGNINEENWSSFHYTGRSKYGLEAMFAALHPMMTSDSLILCIRAGLFGQLSPLMMDLPYCQEPLHIVLVLEGTEVADTLVVAKEETTMTDDSESVGSCSSGASSSDESESSGYYESLLESSGYYESLLEKIQGPPLEFVAGKKC